MTNPTLLASEPMFPAFGLLLVVLAVLGLLLRQYRRKQTEERQSRLTRDRYDLILETLPSALVGVDAGERVTDWNRAAENLFGITAARAVGAKLVDLDMPWDATEALERITHCLGRVTAGDPETLRFTRRDGRQGILEATIATLGGPGTPAGYVLLCTDITERKFLETQLAQAQKLESIGQLAAGIAHEINTPTQYIGDNIRFLQDGFKDLGRLLEVYTELERLARHGPVDPALLDKADRLKGDLDLDYLRREIPGAIEQSLEGVARVTEIVQAMKQFSHPGGIEKTPTNLNAAIASTINVSRNEWKYDVEMNTDLDPALPTVPCLVGEFNQAVLNIILNAVHAIIGTRHHSSKDPGAVTKGRINIRTRVEGEWAEVRIQDTGTGIPAKDRDRIFDPFFTTKEVGKGTGQGLAIAHNVIVGKHGGAITFETEEGVGTTFIIRLPLHPQED